MVWATLLDASLIFFIRLPAPPFRELRKPPPAPGCPCWGRGWWCGDSWLECWGDDSDEYDVGGGGRRGWSPPKVPKKRQKYDWIVIYKSTELSFSPCISFHHLPFTVFSVISPFWSWHTCSMGQSSSGFSSDTDREDHYLNSSAALLWYWYTIRY